MQLGRAQSTAIAHATNKRRCCVVPLVRRASAAGTPTQAAVSPKAEDNVILSLDEWYGYPGGLFGMAFTVGKDFDRKASALEQDADELDTFSKDFADVATYRQVDMESGSSAEQMISFVTGVKADFALAKGSAEVSGDVLRKVNSKTVTRSLAAYCSTNRLLMKTALPLRKEAKRMLKEDGPEKFAENYGTHFVSGVGRRGAFVGSISVTFRESESAVNAAADIKASYGAVSGFAAFKAKMQEKYSGSSTEISWTRWGISSSDADKQCQKLDTTGRDKSFDELQQEAERVANSASGDLTRIRLTSYATLPEYVEAVRDHDKAKMRDFKTALSFVTKQYREAQYVYALLPKTTTGMGIQESSAKLATRVGRYLAELEHMPKDHTAMISLDVFLRYPNGLPGGSSRENKHLYETGKKLFAALDVDKLQYELYKVLHKPDVLTAGSPAGSPIKLCGRPPWRKPRNTVHVAAVSGGGTEAGKHCGRWYLDYVPQYIVGEDWALHPAERGIHIAELKVTPDGKLEQNGNTLHFDTHRDTQEATNCEKYISDRLDGDGRDSVFVVFVADDAQNSYQYIHCPQIAHLGIKFQEPWDATTDNVGFRESVAAISYCIGNTFGKERKVVLKRSGTRDTPDHPHEPQPYNLAMVEAVFEV